MKIKKKKFTGIQAIRLRLVVIILRNTVLQDPQIAYFRDCHIL